MEIISYIKPSLGMNLKDYLNNEMYDIYGGGNITYIEDSPPHINHGSMQINGNVILFNHIGRTWPWDYIGFTIDMWVKPISYGGNSMLISIDNGSSRFWANWSGENWGGWRATLDNIKMKGVPYDKWSRLTICSDEANKKLYAFVNGELQVTITGGNWRVPSFYIGGNDPWNGGGYQQLYLNEIYITPEVRFTEEFDPYEHWVSEYHMIYTNRHGYGIPKEVKSE